jgi:hypothetical protein
MTKKKLQRREATIVDLELEPGSVCIYRGPPRTIFSGLPTIRRSHYHKTRGVPMDLKLRRGDIVSIGEFRGNLCFRSNSVPSGGRWWEWDRGQGLLTNKKFLDKWHHGVTKSYLEYCPPKVSGVLWLAGLHGHGMINITGRTSTASALFTKLFHAKEPWSHESAREKARALGIADG